MTQTSKFFSLVLCFLISFLWTSIISDVEAQVIIYVRSDGSIEPTDFGIINLDNSTYIFTNDILGSIKIERSSITIDGKGYTLHGSGGGNGFYLYGITNVTIRKVNIENFYFGIRLEGNSSFNTICGNNIGGNNQYGVWFSASDNNTFYHNNFVDNIEHVYMDTLCCNSTNVWDNGFEGNYWSNFSQVDLNRDGIGDAAHGVVFGNMDNFPLLGIYLELNASYGTILSTVSNASINELEYFEYNSSIRIQVINEGSDQQFSFIRMRIPHSLIFGSYNVTVKDGNPHYWNYSLYDDGINRWIYFEYENTKNEMIIIPEYFHPEMLALVSLTFLLALLMRKLPNQNTRL